ncbi:VanZ family protein [Paenibacillus albicereus]|uniref:VanZ family protein n=1 Tax=Paenibacillus albicereus TaxID=2726185 RepID=A0A6H2GZ34_9BACL|nr:VanZ family protein [Paenibacillus albicereus]QJC52436.1 VanZ family protein [Paenibacillus albicereus]
MPNESKPRPLRLAAVLAWAAVLLMLTGTESLRHLLIHRELLFSFDPSPDFRAFFRWADIRTVHGEWLLVKLGHFLGFAALDLLLMAWLGSKLRALGLSLLFAVFTEVLQLFQHRDGRLYDVLIDVSGALAAALMVALFATLLKKNPAIPVSNEFNRFNNSQRR